MALMRYSALASISASSRSSTDPSASIRRIAGLAAGRGASGGAGAGAGAGGGGGGLLKDDTDMSGAGTLFRRLKRLSKLIALPRPEPSPGET